MSLHLDGLTITRAGQPLVALARQVGPGQVLTVMGPSGSGKSTLLAALIGALPAAFRMSGRVVLNGRDITTLPTHARRLGILFQDDILFPHLSVGGNLGFGLPRRVRERDRVISRARGLPVVLVTHDLADARAAGGPVVDVQGRPLTDTTAAGG